MLSWLQVRLVIQLGVTLPPELRAEAHPITAGSLVLMTLVLFGCLLISFGIGAPTGASLSRCAGAVHRYTRQCDGLLRILRAQMPTVSASARGCEGHLHIDAAMQAVLR